MFAKQLRELGHEPTINGEYVVFPFVVPGGTYQGREITKAIKVPCDFPITPPPGIEFGPRFEGRPENRGGQHPERSHPSSIFPESGEYWSRPHPNWIGEKSKDARAYMAWVTHLWITT